MSSSEEAKLGGRTSIRTRLVSNQPLDQLTPAHLLQHPSTTPELYEAKVAPLVHKAMNGFNSTIFA